MTKPRDKRKEKTYAHARTFGQLVNEYPSIREVLAEKVGNPSLPPSYNPFKPVYDAVIGPIVDFLEPRDDELVFVSDGALCFTPLHQFLTPVPSPGVRQQKLK